MRSALLGSVRLSNNLDGSPREAGRLSEIPVAQQPMGVTLRRACSRQREEKAFNFAKRGSPHTAPNRCRHHHSFRRSSACDFRHEPPRSFRSGPDREFGGELRRSQLVQPTARSSPSFGRRFLAFHRSVSSSSRIHGRKRSRKRRGRVGPGFRPATRGRKPVASGASIRGSNDRCSPRSRSTSPVLAEGSGLGMGNISSLCRRSGRLEASLLT